jgi:pimeloyl-ACP methyl ester carboxylesterase
MFEWRARCAGCFCELRLNAALVVAGFRARALWWIRRISVCSIALTILTSTGVSAAPPPPDCVILLHGLARTASSMRDMESALKAQGYDVANVDYPSRKFEIALLADLAIEQGISDCGARENRKIHFVTHSLGGILVRYYLTHHDMPNLGRVVMLAPPNQGSEVVDEFGGVPGFRLLNGPAGMELGTDSHSVPLSLGPVTYPVGVIAGTRSINLILSTALPNPDDGKVSLERTKVDGMADFVSFPVSHPFIMQDKNVIRQVIHFLESGTFIHEAP